MFVGGGGVFGRAFGGGEDECFCFGFEGAEVGDVAVEFARVGAQKGVAFAFLDGGNVARVLALE